MISNARNQLVAWRLIALLLLSFSGLLQANTFGLFTYLEYGSYIAIVNYPESANGPAVIPSTINGKPVTKIEPAAFWNCSGLTGVTMPTSITSIGDGAFGFCGLAQVNIPASVTSIDGGAFVGCSVLKSITVHSSNATYSSASGILYNKSKTSLIKCPEGKTGSVVIPASVTSIGIRAFDACNDLTAITIPASVTSIGSYAFASCNRLTGVTIPTSVTSIGSSAFDSCGDLPAIAVDSTNAAYSGVDGLLFNKSQTTLIQCPAGKTGDITIPASVTSIGVGAFSGCSGLTSVTIPAGVTSIGSSTFTGCSSLASMTIPSGVTSIGDNAFSHCGSMSSITIPATVTSIGNSAFRSCSALTSVTIPAGVTSIGYSAFYECRGLTSVTIPTSITSIGSSAFSGCRDLTDVTIPASITSIESSVFSECRGLTSVSIPASVTSIGNSAFSGCRNLTGVTIPASVTSIGEYAFSYCSNLMAITVDPSNANFISVDGILLNKSQTTLIQCPGGKTGEVIIPATVTSIGSSAFSGCRSLTSVTISASVTSIGSSAFSGCSGLTSVNIPASITSIGSSAFSGCSGLTSVNIPASVTSIGGYAFSGCSGLTSLSIPASVTSMAGDAFHGCINLIAIMVDPANSAFSSADGILFNKSQTGIIRCPGGKAGVITIPASVTSISSSAFSGCGALTNVIIPASVTSIGSSAFSGASGMTNVTIPASVTSIGSYAFYGCSSLTEITVDPSNAAYSSVNGILFNKSQTTLIQYPGGKSGSYTVPGGVTSIAGSAFSGCAGLTSVSIPASVTSIGDFAFYGCMGLLEIMVDPSNTAYSSVDGILFNKSRTVLIQYPGGKSGSAIIPAGVMDLVNGAFNDNESLMSLCFLGDSPSTIWYSFPQTVIVHYFDGAIGFTPPYWTSHTVVNMGSVSPIKPWLLGHGFSFDANLLSDPNSDGVNLLMAYAFGLDPTRNLSGNMPQPEVAEGWMSLNFYAGSEGISYKVETSASTQGWTTVGVTLSPPDANGYRTASVPTSDPSRFMRVVVSD